MPCPWYQEVESIPPPHESELALRLVLANSRGLRSEMLEHLLRPDSNPASVALESVLLTLHCTMSRENPRQILQNRNPLRSPSGGGGGWGVGGYPKQEKSTWAWEVPLRKDQKARELQWGSRHFSCHQDPLLFDSRTWAHGEDGNSLALGLVVTNEMWAGSTCSHPFLWHEEP